MRVNLNPLRLAMLRAAHHLITASTVGLERSPMADEPVRIQCGDEIVPYFTEHPALASRRAILDASDLVGLLTEALVRRGMPIEKLKGTKWVWVKGDTGLPRLCLIFPGLEA